MQLGEGTLRFNEIKRKINGISQRMLTLTLRGLQRDGLIRRQAFGTIPPKVEYSLTELGRSLQAPVAQLAQWAIEHRFQIESAQSEFDREFSAAEPDL